MCICIITLLLHYIYYYSRYHFIYILFWTSIWHLQSRFVCACAYTHTQYLPIPEKDHHMLVHYYYCRSYVRDIYYFGLLYDTCNADLCVCLLLHYIYYYSRYYNIYIILDFYMIPAMQVFVCFCVCLYICTHTHNLPILTKYHHMLSSSCYLEKLKIFTHYNFPGKRVPLGSRWALPRARGRAVPAVTAAPLLAAAIAAPAISRGFLQGDCVHASTSD